jgi:hypothetical protein
VGKIVTVSMAEGPEETWLGCVEGGASGSWGDGIVATGHRGLASRLGPNRDVDADCVFDEVSRLGRSTLCDAPGMIVETPADMMALRYESGRVEWRRLWGGTGAG